MNKFHNEKSWNTLTTSFSRHYRCNRSLCYWDMNFPKQKIRQRVFKIKLSINVLLLLGTIIRLLGTTSHISFHRIHHHKPGPRLSSQQPGRLTRKEPVMTYWLLCGFRTNVLTNLRSHLRNHSKKDINQCSRCSYSSGCTRVLKNHFERDHPKWINRPWNQLQGELSG